jgi:hypothetical protein
MQDFCLTLSKVLSKSTQATFLRGLISFYNPAMDAPAFPITPVADDNLDITTFPKRRDPFDSIVKFAYTFDGYAHFGMEKCAEIANAALSTFYHTQVLPDDIDVIRACLFFEARRWTLYKKEPDNKGMIYIHALIDRLEKQLKAKAESQG